MTPRQKNKKFTFILTSQNGQSEFSSEWLEAPIISRVSLEAWQWAHEELVSQRAAHCDGAAAAGLHLEHICTFKPTDWHSQKQHKTHTHTQAEELSK